MDAIASPPFGQREQRDVGLSHSLKEPVLGERILLPRVSHEGQVRMKEEDEMCALARWPRPLASVSWHVDLEPVMGGATQ